MKVLLKEHVEGVGHLGDVVEVADGFARNYLLPRKKAIVANERNIREFEHYKRIMAEKARKEKIELEAYAQRLSTVALSFTMQAGKEGKLFGSVTSRDIEEQLAEKGFAIDRKKILLAQPIKTLGTVVVPIKLHRDVTATVTVEVRTKQEDTAPPGVATGASGSSEAQEKPEAHARPQPSSQIEGKEKTEKKVKKTKKEVAKGD
jgi:large subunit ribosomal protein L9